MSGREFRIVFRRNLWELASWPLDVLKNSSEWGKKRTQLGKGMSLERDVTVLWPLPFLGSGRRCFLLTPDLTAWRELWKVFSMGDWGSLLTPTWKPGCFWLSQQSTASCGLAPHPKSVGPQMYERILETRWRLLGQEEDVGLLWFKIRSEIQYSLQEMTLSSPLLECGPDLVTCFWCI